MSKARTPAVSLKAPAPPAPATNGKAKTATTTPAAAPETKTALPPRELTDVQALVCDLIGDMVLNGANHEDLDQVLAAAVRHSIRHSWPGDAAEMVDKHADGIAGRYATEIIKRWPEPLPPFEEKVPVTYSDRLRRGFRASLQDWFRDFLANATAAEVHLMAEVMCYWRSISYGPISHDAEIALAQAMGYFLDHNTTLFRAPRTHAELIEKFIQALPE
jgi:hypothetical protein